MNRRCIAQYIITALMIVSCSLIGPTRTTVAIYSMLQGAMR
jgi:hypothetical protein